MTKRFALPDTLPDPYFTIEAGGDAVVVIRPYASIVPPPEARRMIIEIWRDGKILCRVFAKSAHVASKT